MAVSGGGVTVNNVVVGSRTSLTANFVLDRGRRCRCPHGDGHDGRRDQRRADLHDHPPAPGAPTLTSVAPNQGIQGTTVAVTLTGTNFVVGATTVSVGGGGVTVTTVVVGSTTSLTANFVLDPAAAAGARAVTVTTAGGTSGSANLHGQSCRAPTLTSVAPNQGLRGATVVVTLTGANFVVGATTVAVSGARRDGQHRRRGQHDVADRQLRARSGRGCRCPHGDGHDGRRDSGAQSFTISVPPPGSQTFAFTPRAACRPSQSRRA